VSGVSVGNINDVSFMQQAISLAIKAQEMNEVPVGAVVIQDNQIIGEGWNQPIGLCDPTSHAEVIALRAAAKHVDNYRLTNCSLYVTLEPCMMCAGAIIHSRIQKLIFGAFDPKSGVAGSTTNLFTIPHINHRVRIEGGVLQEECGTLLTKFFQKKR
jgi:tRNA(adenine34) deaminase